MRRERKAQAFCLGYGNRLRGDDAVGPYVAAQLGGMAVHQLVPELAERLAGQRLIVFIDARRDLEPGAVEILPIGTASVMTHSCSPGYLMRLVREVYGRAPQALMVGIGGEAFEWGAPLSVAARLGARQAIARIHSLR
jgi:hydrogenase maturation protease